MRIINILFLICIFFIPFQTAFAQDIYDSVNDDAYSAEFDSIYDSAELDAAQAADEDAVQDTTSTIVPRENTSKRRHHPRYYLSLGGVGNFRFDTFLTPEDSFTNIFGGVSGSIRFGVIGEDFHWSIEQLFGHIWGLSIKNGSQDMTRFDAATLVEVSMSYAIRRKLTSVMTIGAGFLYTMPHTGDPGLYDGRLSVDKKGTNLGVALKIAAAIVYEVAWFFSIGADLSYFIGTDIGSYLEGEFSDSRDESVDRVLLELLQPSIFVVFKF